MPSRTHEAPCLFPTLRCQDAEAMIAWLTQHVGFTEHAVHRDNGVIMHAAFALGASILMLGQSRDDAYGKLVGDPSGRRTDALYVAIADPDALHATLKAAGATIEMALHDTAYGSREFACRDPEGNLWSFGTYWPKTRSEAEA